MNTDASAKSVSSPAAKTTTVTEVFDPYSAASDLVPLNAGMTSSAIHWNCSSITCWGVQMLVERLMCSSPGKRASSFLRCSTSSPDVPANQEPSFMKCSSVGTPASAQP